MTAPERSDKDGPVVTPEQMRHLAKGLRKKHSAVCLKKEAATMLEKIASTATVPECGSSTELMSFYGVSTTADLIDAQAKHIEKLQAKLPSLRDTEIRNPRKG